MTKKELQKEMQVRFNSLNSFCERLSGEINMLKALFESQKEINELLAEQLEGELSEEDYVWGGDLTTFMGKDISIPKEIRTRWVFNKFKSNKSKK